jgi:hypothetical protein
MADLFPLLRTDEKVQVGDKFRFDASKSFVAPSGSITKYEFDPNNTLAWIDAGTTSYLDWVYSTAGAKTCGLRITSGTTSTVTTTLTAVSTADDALFSNDSDLVEIEPTIMKYLPQERSSFKYVHRRAQKHILDSLDQHRVYLIDGTRITAAEILDVQEVKNWSTLQSLAYIFDGLSNASDDVFSKKAKLYRDKSQAAMHMAFRYDYNQDDEITEGETRDLFTTEMVRR